MILFLILTVLIVLWIVKCSIKPKKFPPGPRRLPIMGSYPSFFKKKSLIHNIKDLVSEYGPICGLYVGSRKTVIIADYDVLREVFKKEEASHRPPTAPGNENRPGWWTMDISNKGRPPGVLLSGAQYWREQRRFLLRNLRDFGFGKSSMESLISEEMLKICSKLKQLGKHGPLNLNRMMNASILNAFWKILMGEKLELDDPKLAKVLELFDEFFRKTSGTFSPFIACLPSPAMGKWPFFSYLTEHETRRKAFIGVRDFIEPYIVNHKETLDPDNIRDFTDLMLLEIQNTTDPTSSFFGDKGYFALFNDIIDLFLAGSETTTSSLMWLFLYMIHHPEIQEKVHNELDEVVGRTRYPSLDDRPRLHYFNAVLFESMRAASLVVAGVPHQTTQDITVGKYIIPKDTILFGSLYHIMNDPKVFEDPHVFNPDRFLDSNGKFRPDEHVIPFSIGKRICLGQSLADKEFFLFSAGILQQFKITRAPQFKTPPYQFDLNYPNGTIRMAPEFFVNLEERLNC